MAEVRTCEAFELFNLLNQCRNASRLADLNYLYLVDARVLQDYNTSHILAAKSGKMDSDGNFVLPPGVEVDSMQHVVVYDSDTKSLRENGRAVACAQVLAKVSLCPVYIVRGGYQRFSALYPYLRTEKMMYTYMELESLKIYPMEIIAGQLYMGNLKQAVDPSVLAHLKITTIISISESDALESVKENRTILNIPVADSVHSDLYSSFKRVCLFIESQINMNARVLVVSKQGRSRCSAIVIAFVMQHLKYTLEEAWNYLLKCKPNMRPNTGFLQQLSDWELHLSGAKLTDISETLF